MNDRKVLLPMNLAKIVTGFSLRKLPRSIGTRVARSVGPVVVLLAYPLALEAQPLSGQQAALIDLTSLRVEVQLVGAAATIGFSESSISEAVEQRLRRDGLEVRSRDDRSARGDPRLRIAVQAVNAAGGYAFLVSVQLVERVVNYRRYGELVLDGSNGRYRRWAQRAGRTRSTRFRTRSPPTWTGSWKIIRLPTSGRGSSNVSIPRQSRGL